MAATHCTISLTYIWKSSYYNHSDLSVWIPNAIIILGLLSIRSLFSLTIGPIVWIYLPEIV